MSASFYCRAASTEICRVEIAIKYEAKQRTSCNSVQTEGSFVGTRLTKPIHTFIDLHIVQSTMNVKFRIVHVDFNSSMRGKYG